MGQYFRRLIASGAAYQAARVLSGAMALITLPLYTGHLTPTEYGYAETLLTFIILMSILLRMGIGEAVVRFWFDDDDHARRIDVARTTTSFAAATTTVAALLGLVFAAPLSDLLLDTHDPGLMRHIERSRRLADDVQGGVRGEPFRPGQDGGQRLAVDQLHDQVSPAELGRLAVVVDPRDARVGQAGRVPRLGPEPG